MAEADQPRRGAAPGGGVIGTGDGFQDKVKITFGGGAALKALVRAAARQASTRTGK